MQRTLRQPGFWLAVGLTAIGVACQAFLSMPLELIDAAMRHLGSVPLQLGREPLVLGLVNILALGTAIWIGLLVNRLPLRRAFPLGAIRSWAWVSVPVLMLGAGILLSEADNLFRWLLPMPEFLAKIMAEMFFPEGRFFSQFFLLVMVAPLTEELLFRGIILRGLMGRYRAGVAVLLSALLFAGMHLNPWQLISAFVLGLIFGWFYLRTGSLWPCLAGHACYNSIVVIVGAAPFGLWDRPTPADLTVVEFQPLWLDALGVGLAGLGVWLFRKGSPGIPDPQEPKPPVLEGPEAPPVLPAC